MKIRRYVLNRIHRANGTSTMLPTAQELAKQFGCSRPTVCKAMKTLTEDGFVIGKPGIGSFINPALETCHDGGSMNGLPIIGIIFGDGMVVHYEIFFGKVLAKILELVVSRPAVLHIINLTSTNPDKIIREILGEDLDGLLWEAPSVTSETLSTLRENGLPVVALRGEPTDETDCVYFDMERLGVDIAERLLALKRRNIVFLADRPPWNTYRHSLLRSFEKEGITLNDKLFLNGGENCLPRLREILELGVPVDAVINPLFQVQKVLEIFKSMRITPGDRCTVVNNGIYKRESDAVPGGLHYDLPIGEYTAAAVRRMWELLDNRKLPPKQIAVPVPLLET